VARRATRITQERDKGGIVLVLDAGDSLTGDQEPASKTKGQSSITLMNKLGYDAMVLGPADLHLGVAALRERIKEANFDVLSANAAPSGNGAVGGEALAKPYVLRELGGHTVALAGLSGGQGTPEITVREPLETAQALVAEISQQADVIILLSHAGDQTDRQIATAVASIDLIVSGGTPGMAEPWRSPKTGTLVVRADQASSGHAGRNLGIIQLSIDSSGQVVKYTWQQVALGPEIPDDPAIASWVQQQIQ
jgi:2',3'-cyclic-nucleotide 2'-phosphodiesterase (5'-nucleotidase family)